MWPLCPLPNFRRDAGVLQTARYVTSPELIDSMRMALLKGRSAVPREFEVLLEVKRYRRTAASARILDAHALGGAKN